MGTRSHRFSNPIMPTAAGVVAEVKKGERCDVFAAMTCCVQLNCGHTTGFLSQAGLFSKKTAQLGRLFYIKFMGGSGEIFIRNFFSIGAFSDLASPN